MRPYTSDQKFALRERYLAAAIIIVTRDGWQAAGIRALAAEIGVTAPSINRIFKSLDLKLALVSYAHTGVTQALLPGEGESRTSHLADASRLLSRYIRANPQDAALMVQVAAQAGLSGDRAVPIVEYIALCRRSTVDDFLVNDPAIIVYDGPRRREQADRLMENYMIGCLALVTNPAIDDNRLHAICSG